MGTLFLHDVPVAVRVVVQILLDDALQLPELGQIRLQVVRNRITPLVG